jgi:hypothetical protein
MKHLIKKILKEDEFDWVRETNPITKPEISKKVGNLYPYALDKLEELTTALHNLGLTKEEFDEFFLNIYRLSIDSYENGYNSGINAGYESGSDDGYRDGYGDGVDNMKRKVDEGYEKGYNEGFGEAYSEAYEKGYNEGKEETYYKAFEEGRAYQHELENEEFEKGESEFDLDNYDDDYDENY